MRGNLLLAGGKTSAVEAPALDDALMVVGAAPAWAKRARRAADRAAGVICIFILVN